MKVTILGSGSSGGVPLIGNYWGNCDPNNIKNNRTRVSIVISINDNNLLFDTSPDLRIQSIKNNINNILIFSISSVPSPAKKNKYMK